MLCKAASLPVCKIIIAASMLALNFIVDAQSITSQPSDQLNLVLGVDAMFTVVVEGGSSASYFWQKDGQQISDLEDTYVGTNTATMTVLSVDESDEGAYSVVVFAGALLFSLAADLTVLDPPVIETQPMDQLNTIQGQDTTFNVVATGEMLSYQWQKDGQNISDTEGEFSGTTTDTLTVLCDTPEDEGVFLVIVSNPAGSVTSDGADLTVLTPPEITTPPADTEIVPGGTATFTVIASGDLLSYKWFRTAVGGTGEELSDSSTVFGSDSEALFILDVMEANDGEMYHVEVTNPAGSVLAEAVTLTVLDPPTIITQPMDLLNQLPGTNVTFSVEANGLALSYQWQRAGVAIDDVSGEYFGAKSNTLTIIDIKFPDDEDSYNVLVTNEAGFVTSDSAELTVIEQVMITDQPVSVTTTPGEDVQFSVTATGDMLSYQWQRNGVNVTNGPDYSGVDTDTLTVLSVTDSVDEATYRVIVSNPANLDGVISDDATLTVLTSPIITRQPVGQLVEIGANVTFSVDANVDALIYSWQKDSETIEDQADRYSGTDTDTLTILGVIDPDDVGTYAVVVANAVGITTSDEVLLEIIRCPSLSVPTNGDVLYSTSIFSDDNYRAGTEATYNCSRGDLFDGDTSRTCQANGTWSGVEPVCIDYCLPLDLLNGRITFSTVENNNGNYANGTVATYECDDGFSLVGSITRTCMEGDLFGFGQWSNTAATCEAIGCPALVIENGTVSYDVPMDGSGNDFGSISDFPFDTIATYSCLPGYSLVGSSTRTCGGDGSSPTGSFNGSAPTCEPIECPPLVLDNGDISYVEDMEANFEIGTVATHYCEDGFALVGDVDRTCVADNQEDIEGVWDGEAPTCEPIECPALVIENGTVSYDVPMDGSGSDGDFGSDLPFDTIATYSCLPGYSLVGSSTRTCGGDGSSPTGSFNGSAPTCEPIECPPLVLDNGDISYVEDMEANFEIGTVAMHSCEDGFALVGDVDRTCVADNQEDIEGVWDGEAPTCQSIECPALVIENGTVSYDVPMDGSGNDFGSGYDFPFDTIATYSCLPGYSLVGPSTRTCGGDGSSPTGSFNGSAPTCEPIECPPLVLDNGGISYVEDMEASFEIGTVATHYCEDGFALVGDVDRTCVANNQEDIEGVWDGEAPTCQPIECPALVIENGTVSYDVPMDGSGSDGDFGSDLPFDTIATYSCLPGYSLVGSSTRTCGGDGSSPTGSFNGSAPTCEPIECPPLVLDNGDISYVEDMEANFEIGTVATHYCEDGFALVGVVDRTCVADNQEDTEGVWDGEAPTCQSIECPALVIENGTVSYDVPMDGSGSDGDFGSDLPFDTIATYSCLPGYSLVGSSTRTCGGDGSSPTGSFNGSAPTCEPIECLPLVLDNGGISYVEDMEANFEIGTVATHYCEDGFALVGDVDRTCVADNQEDIEGVWDGEAPTCELIECPVLVIENGIVSYELPMDGPGDPMIFDGGSGNDFGSGSDFPFDTIATYSCLPGYSLVGSSTRTCGGDGSSPTGSFNGSAPTCEPIECPPLVLDNGNVSYVEDMEANFEIDTVAMHSCEDGFALVGDVIRICVDDNQEDTVGDWDGEAPTCKPTCPPLGVPISGGVNYSTSLVSNEEYLSGTVAVYSCDGDTELFGNVMRTCQDNHVWNGSDPTCQIVCPRLDDVVGGSISYSIPPNTNDNFGSGTVASHVCSGQLGLLGQENRTCEDSREWSGSAPTCELIMCPDLPDPENGDITFFVDNTATFDVTTIAIYSCDEGYVLFGEYEVRTCTGTNESPVGDWDGEAPSCQPITCPPLTVPSNVVDPIAYSTSPDPTNYVFETTAMYTCSEGFGIVDGDEIRTCIEDGNSTVGMWSGIEPVCESIVFMCPDIPDPKNGQIEFGDDMTAPFDLEVTAVYSCYCGFGLDGGDSVRTCEGNSTSILGAWSGVAPQCLAISCSPLDDPINGTIYYNEDQDDMGNCPYETLATYSCESGFGIVGTAISTCGGNGSSAVGVFDQIAPTCEPITCAPLDEPLYGDTIYYEVVPDSPLEDLGSGFDLSFGTIATYSCMAGFGLVGSLTRTCSGDGSSPTGYFDGSPPTCEPIMCPHIADPKHGQIYFSPDDIAPFDLETVASYSCDLGFELAGGDYVRTCEGNTSSPVGYWTGTAPYCAAVVLCPDLEVPDNGTIEYVTDTVPDFEFGTTATYSCVEGFGLSGGDAVRTCGCNGIDDSTGLWSGSAPYCQPIQCPDIPDPFDGQIKFSPDRSALFDFNTTASYSCEDGFTLSDGDPVRICVGDGNSSLGEWSGMDLVCAAASSEGVMSVAGFSAVRSSVSLLSSTVSVEFAETEYDVTEGDTVSICVKVSGTLINAVLVNVSTVAGEAHGSGVDYAAVSKTLTFVQSPDEICFPVVLTEDSIYEDDEQFKVRLSSTNSQITIASPYSTVTIKDNDQVELSLIVDELVCEGAGSVTVCVNLTTETQKDVEAVVETFDGHFAKDPEDYKKAVLLFSFSAPSPAKSVICKAITIVDDNVVEPCENFIVVLTISSERAVISGESLVRVQINDDEDISEMYLTNHSPQIKGDSLNAMFVLNGCAQVKCAVYHGTKEEDCTPPIGSFNGKWYISNSTNRITSQSLSLSVQPYCGQAGPDDISRGFRRDNKKQCSLHFTDKQYTIDSANGDVTVEWEGTGPSQHMKVKEFKCIIDEGAPSPCTSPHVIAGQVLSHGDHILNVIPVKIDGCDRVPSRNLRIRIPN